MKHDAAAEVVQVHSPEDEVPQPPPKPPDDDKMADEVSLQGQRPRRFPRVDYEALHEYGGQGRGQQGGLRGRRDRERRGAPE